MTLSKKRCVPCEGGAKPIPVSKAKKLLKQLNSWKISKGKLEKNFKFKDFKKTLAFVNKVGRISEKEGHHPDIYFTWGKCKIRIYTHAISGLSENDFILASKIDKIKL